MRHYRRIVVCVLASFLLLASVVPAQAADSSDTDLAAGWLARTLASNNDLAVLPTGGADYASTAYALVGLRAAGVAGDQIGASARAMAQSGDAFVGTPDQADSKATAISLMILAMVAGGLDPSQYTGSAGTRDLYADLESTIQSDGAVSSMATAYGQSFAILALLSAPGGVPSQVSAWLLEQPCADSTSPGYGGYGFSGPGSCNDVDPDSTALAVISLVDSGLPVALFGPARAYLTSVQDSSGGFASSFSGINANTTGLAVAALNVISPSSPEAGAGVEFLESLMYDCDPAPSLAGAMALTSDSRSTTRIDPLTDADRAVFFQASAQGIYGFVDKVTTPVAYEAASAAAPDSSCLTSSASSSPSPGSSISPVASGSSDAPSSAAGNWLWAIGGFLVIILVYIGWRFLIAARKS